MHTDVFDKADALQPAGAGQTNVRAGRRSGGAIRVCLVGPSLALVGGQSVQLARLAERLRATPGIEVGFIPMNPTLPGPLGWLQRVKLVRTVVTSLAYWLLLLGSVRRYDVIHVFSPSYWAFLLGPVPAMFGARMWRRPVLLNYHSGEAADHLSNWRTAVPLLRLADRIVVPSGYLRDVFARFGLPATSIHNFVEVESIPYRERTHPRPRFLSNRNLEPIYHVACSLRAFAMIQRVMPEASLVVAGDGSERAGLEALVTALGARNVHFTGRVPPERMAMLLDEADILLNSPRVDNMPLSLIEAQAAGVLIASTSTGGIPYVVENGRTGLLVATDDCEALAAAAMRFLDEPGLAGAVSREARATCVERFSWSSVEAAWRSVYEELAGRAPTSPLHGA